MQKVVGARSTTVMPYMADGDYYWKIAAGRYVGGMWTYYDWSAVEPFTVHMLGTPTLISPPHQSSTTDHTVRLRWTDVAGAERYRIRVIDDAGPSLAAFVIVGDKETTVLPYLGDGTYSWRVAAGKYLNGKWTWYNWSDIWGFEIYTP
jgi:long-subunit fatty acid transport protein